MIVTYLTRAKSLIPHQLSPARVAIFIGIILVATTLTKLTSRLVLQPSTSLVTTGDGAQPSITTPPYATSAANFHLFGVSQSQSELGVDAPESTLEVTLRGTILLPERRSIAIVEHGDEERPYKVGDALPGGAVIHDILARSVIIDRAGRYETLSLPLHSALSNFIATNSNSAPSTNSSGGHGNSGHFSDLQKRLQPNTARANAISSSRQEAKDGPPQGYRVGDNAYMPVLRNAGIKPGDVITRINGKPANAQTSEAELLNQLASTGHASVEIKREGSVISLSVNLKK